MKRLCFIPLTLVLVCAACSSTIDPIPSTDQLVGFGIKQPTDDFGYSLSPTREGATLAGNVGIMAYYCPTGEWSASLTPAFMYNTPIVASTGSYYNQSDMRYWPALPAKVAFFAYWPYCAQGDGAAAQLSAISAEGLPSIDYTAPATTAAANDFLVADGVMSDCEQGSVSLQLRHAMAKIVFKVNTTAADNVSLVSLYMTGVRNRATYSFALDGTGSWSTPTGSATYNVAGSEESSEAVAFNGLAFESDAAMVIPQTLTTTTDNVTVDVRYRVDDSSTANVYFRSFNLSDLMLESWQPNNVYTYTLTIDTPSAGVELGFEVESWSAGTTDITLTSSTGDQGDNFYLYGYVPNSTDPCLVVENEYERNLMVLDKALSYGKLVVTPESGSTLSYRNFRYDYVNEVVGTPDADNTVWIDLDNLTENSSVYTLSNFTTNNIIYIAYHAGTKYNLKVKGTTNTVGNYGDVTTDWQAAYFVHDGVSDVRTLSAYHQATTINADGEEQLCNYLPANASGTNTVGYIRLTRNITSSPLAPDLNQ